MSSNGWQKLVAATCLGMLIPTLLLNWTEPPQWLEFTALMRNNTVSHNLPDAPSDDGELARTLWRYLENPELGCRKLRLFGGITYPEGDGAIDGDKFVCLDQPWAPDPAAPDGCLVYSFGINNEWSFDRAMGRFGCEVHAFDPSMSEYNRTVTEFGAQFYKLGLAGRTGQNSRGWPVTTLTDIRKRLGHERRAIDYLKVDVEGDEWSWLAEDGVSLQHVRQMGIELHLNVTSPAALRSHYTTLRRVSQAGFRTVHSNLNRVHGKSEQVPGLERKVAKFIELVWVKV